MRLHLLKTALLMIALSTASLACESDTSNAVPAEEAAPSEEATPSEEAAPAEETAPAEEPAEEAAPAAEAPPEGQGQLDDPSLAQIEDLGATDAAECESNDDCKADEVCYSQSDNPPGPRFCLPGTRGTREFGEPCDEEVGTLQCDSGICVWYLTPDGEARTCTIPCDETTECPEPLSRCIFGVCHSPTGD